MTGRRLEIGFEGGSVLQITVSQDAADGLVASLGGVSWQTVDADEGTYWLNPAQLSYVRLVADAGPKIGFGNLSG
jgi:hypothetical protein